MPIVDFLNKRVLFVTGKGGVGKSTVAIALGIRAAMEGRRTIIVEVASTENASRMFRQEEVGFKEVEISNDLWSISIDPEQDTPRRLTAYAKRFGSAGTWAHYTSSSADAIEIQRAFGAWRGDKMNHQPTTYMRGAPGKPWVRLDGFFSPEDLVSNYLHVVQGQGDDNCAEPPRKTAANSHLTLASTRPQTFSSTADHPVGLPTKTKP